MSSYSANNEALIRSVYANLDRDAILRRAEGVICETFNRRANFATLAAVSGAVSS